MIEHRPEVADFFRQHGQEFLERWGHALSWQQIKALRDIGRMPNMDARRSRQAV